MDILWAPWRMQYILQSKPEGCIFCDKPGAENDRENLILYRASYSFIIMNYFPYNNGHLMIVPYKHTASLTDLQAPEHLELMTLLGRSVDVLKKSIKAQGVNIGMNLGTVAGAGIDDHLHFHIVPRWNGDTNFMPISGHVKVLSEGLYETYDHLKPYFD